MMIAFSKGQRDREGQKESIMYGIKIQGPWLPLLPTSRVPKASTNLSSSIATRLKERVRERGEGVCVCA